MDASAVAQFIISSYFEEKNKDTQCHALYNHVFISAGKTMTT